MLEIKDTESVKDAAYTGQVPRHYHDGLREFLFEPYARDTAMRVKAFAPQYVLELACGTGIVTRELVRGLGGARLLATDLNPDMLEEAKATIGEELSPLVSFRVANMCATGLPNGRFGAIVCQFGLMFVPPSYRHVALKEMRRLLAHDGRLFLNTWGGLDRNDFAMLAHEVVYAHAPHANFFASPTGPFCCGDPELLKLAILAAGFQDVAVDLVEKEATAPSARALAVGLIRGYPVAHVLDECGKTERVIDALEQRIALSFGDVPKTRATALVATAQ